MYLFVISVFFIGTQNYNKEKIKTKNNKIILELYVLLYLCIDEIQNHCTKKNEGRSNIACI